MKNHLIISLLILSVGVSQQSNPCKDKLFVELILKIENEGLEALSEREWEYWTLKNEECKKHKKDNSNYKIKNSTQYEEEMLNIEKERLRLETENAEKNKENWDWVFLYGFAFITGNYLIPSTPPTVDVLVCGMMGRFGYD